jgi:hypothetical protein
MQIIFKGVSDPHGAAVYLTREAVRSPWSSDERFVNVAYDIFIFHYNARAKLLFICSSRRHAKFYSRIARLLVTGRPRPLSNNRINRVLNDLTDSEFFSVGMRKRHKLGQIESYRMIAGPSADKAVHLTDARTFDRGHCFGTAKEDGNAITIGVSVGSKVWSNTYDRIPELLDWCNRLANKIASRNVAVTGSGLDLLSAGEELTEVPDGIIAMTWPPEVYMDSPRIAFTRPDESIGESDLLDFELEVLDSHPGICTFALRNTEIEWRGQFTLGVGSDLFQPRSAEEPTLVVQYGSDEIPFEEYLNESMPTLYRSDLSAIEGPSLYPAPAALEAFDNNLFEVVDWNAAGVEITSEKTAGVGSISIFDWLRTRLVGSGAVIVFCDDGAGEMADFVAIHQTAGGPRVKMYHCKASGDAAPGNRIKDLEIVCAQAIKSSVWIRPENFLARLRYRATLGSVPGYLKGDEATAALTLAPQVQRHIQFETYIVQPGVLREGRTEPLSNLLAAARDYLADVGINSFGVIGS